jgi:hypothetical protein
MSEVKRRRLPFDKNGLRFEQFNEDMFNSRQKMEQRCWENNKKQNKRARVGDGKSFLRCCCA